MLSCAWLRRSHAEEDERRMSSTADVVIIGGGVIGASVAYHLAARGQKRIVVLDRTQGPGLGSTGRATGGFRGQFSTRVNVQLSLLARDKLTAFRDETGTDPGYRPCGYLFLASNADQLAAVRPVRRQVAVTYPAALLPEEMPLTIFVDDGFHLRVRDGRVLLLWPADLPADDPFDTAFDARWLTPLLDRARAHVPVLRGLQIDRDACWAGLYEMSADRHAVLGQAPGVQGLYLANGSSGHGVMHAPALGHLTAEFVLDGTATTVDVHALRPERFAEGALNPESGVL